MTGMTIGIVPLLCCIAVGTQTHRFLLNPPSMEDTFVNGIGNFELLVLSGGDETGKSQLNLGSAISWEGCRRR